MNAVELMLEVIRENSPKSIWRNAPLEPFRRVENTNRGDIGEEFLRRYLLSNGEFEINKRGHRAEDEDLQIESYGLEIKTASLGANGTFQFNHVRYDKQYRFLICLGVCPDKLVFNAWTKEALSVGEAGRLVRMAEGQSTTFKLTKRLGEMRPIEEFVDWVRAEIGSGT